MKTCRETCQYGVAILLLALSLSASASSVRIFALTADTWASPRSGGAIRHFERVAVNLQSGQE